MTTKCVHQFEVGRKPTEASVHICNNAVHIGTSHNLQSSAQTCDRGIEENKDAN